MKDNTMGKPSKASIWYSVNVGWLSDALALLLVLLHVAASVWVGVLNVPALRAVGFLGSMGSLVLAVVFMVAMIWKDAHVFEMNDEQQWEYDMVASVWVGWFPVVKMGLLCAAQYPAFDQLSALQWGLLQWLRS